MAKSRRKLQVKVAKPPPSSKGQRAPRRAFAAPPAYAALLGLASLDAQDLHRRVLGGIAYSAIERLRTALELTADELSDVVGIKARTLARRKVEGRLSAGESDRVVRAARVFGAAMDLFEGDGAAARRWLKTRNRALGEATPLDVMRTDVGARDVDALIGALEHGIVP